MGNLGLFEFNNEVAAALAHNRPLVALESTVISHGLPRPLNLETALKLEEVVRSRGATPATVAILNGKVCIGLGRDQLDHVANSDDIHKVSRRDLAVLIARAGDGATTVATTVWAAHKAGIKVLATGGIGGVHRGKLPDVSADLPELERTPFIVVCSGAKSVLDLAATREWLETHGITVVGYKCDEMPAFYSRRSGLPIDARVDSAAEVVELARTRDRLRLNGALLVTVPVPREAEVDAQLIDEMLESSTTEAAREGITGRELTPFLLSRMAELSNGATMRANTALLENNAGVAADIAVAQSALKV